MATGQTLLNLMELLDQELQMQAGEEDVTRGLIALNAAQDLLESMLTKRPRVFGDTTGTVVTVASTETTTFPSGVLRIDRIQWIDPQTSRPSGPDLEWLGFVGSHTQDGVGLEAFLGSTVGAGRPRGYWTQGRSIYWSPLPDAVHTLRWYGLSAQTDVTASGTFLYPDHAMLPLATIATKLFQIGLGDPVDAYEALGEQVLGPTIEAMGQYVQDRAPGYDYRFDHDA